MAVLGGCCACLAVVIVSARSGCGFGAVQLWSFGAVRRFRCFLRLHIYRLIKLKNSQEFLIFLKKFFCDCLRWCSGLGGCLFRYHIIKTACGCFAVVVRLYNEFIYKNSKVIYINKKAVKQSVNGCNGFYINIPAAVIIKKPPCGGFSVYALILCAFAYSCIFLILRLATTSAACLFVKISLYFSAIAL